MSSLNLAFSLSWKGPFPSRQTASQMVGLAKRTLAFNQFPKLTSTFQGVPPENLVLDGIILYIARCFACLSKLLSVLTLNISEEEQKNLLCHTLCDILELACFDHSESYCLATWQRGKTAEETAGISESPAETSRQEEQPCKLSFLT